jgi:PAS domain S-box-containing protein
MALIRSPGIPTRSALLAAGVYAVASAAWIAWSDAWVAGIFTDAQQLTRAQTLKGWFFVTASSVVVFILVRRAVVAYRARLRADEHLGVALDTIPGRVYWKDRELRYLGCNSAWAREVGLEEPGEIRGLRAAELPRPPANLEEIEREERRILAEGVPRLHREESKIGPDGAEGWDDVSRVPLRDEDGGITGVLVHAEDVTERKAAEIQLRHAQRIQTLGELTSGVAHDFKNVLSVIRANADLLADGALEPGEASDALEDIRSATAGASGIVRNLLTFGRREELELRPTDVGGLVNGLAPMFSRLLDPSYRFQIDLRPGTPNVLADPMAVEQVLLNLLTNARDAMPEGGGIRISVEPRGIRDVPTPAEDRFVSSPAPGSGRYVSVRVEDAGKGMSERELASAFDPFFTTKPRGQGTGLGLPMVLSLMNAQGGGLILESRPGEGTAVELLFAEAPEGIAAETDGTGRVDGEGKRVTGTILVVDDQQDLRRTIRRVLARNGFRVLEAGDGREAVRVMEERGGEVDLVLSDLVMPGMGGVELQRWIDRHAGRRVPFILTSGVEEVDRLSRSGMGEGIPRTLPKPWTVQELLEGVRRALEPTGSPRE